MGIFNRLGDLVKANANDAIDRMEEKNPEKMVKQIVIDLQKEVNKATQNLGKAKANERIAKAKYNNALKVSQDWENKAKTALSQGNQELAKEAISRKVRADEDVTSYKSMYDSISSQTDEIEEQVNNLKAKLDEAKSRQSMLIARSQMADTKKNIAKSQGNFDGSSALEKFNRMEEKIIQKEAEADAFSEIAGGADTDLNDAFAQLESDSRVEAEMARLMAEMNGNSPENNK